MDYSWCLLWDRSLFITKFALKREKIHSHVQCIHSVKNKAMFYGLCQSFCSLPYTVFHNPLFQCYQSEHWMNNEHWMSLLKESAEKSTQRHWIAQHVTSDILPALYCSFFNETKKHTNDTSTTIYTLVLFVHITLK